MNPEVRVCLFIESEEMSADEMSNEIGYLCDECHEKGSPTGRGAARKVWDVSGWELNHRAVSPTGAVFDFRDTITAAVQAVLNRIAPHADGFRRVAQRAKSAGILLATESPWTPPLEFDPPILAALANLGAGLYIDVQLTDEEASTESDDM